MSQHIFSAGMISLLSSEMHIVSAINMMSKSDDFISISSVYFGTYILSFKLPEQRILKFFSFGNNFFSSPLKTSLLNLVLFWFKHPWTQNIFEKIVKRSLSGINCDVKNFSIVITNVIHRSPKNERNIKIHGIFYPLQRQKKKTGLIHHYICFNPSMKTELSSNVVSNKYLNNLWVVDYQFL